MAGSTRLLGYAGDRLVLYRWGQRAEVKIGEPAVQEIDRVCRERLPKRPPAPGSGGPFAEFDAVHGGRVCLWLMPRDAEALAVCLRAQGNELTTQAAEQLEAAVRGEKDDDKAEDG